jgi:hypothetical protein
MACRRARAGKANLAKYAGLSGLLTPSLPKSPPGTAAPNWRRRLTNFRVRDVSLARPGRRPSAGRHGCTSRCGGVCMPWPAPPRGCPRPSDTSRTSRPPWPAGCGTTTRRLKQPPSRSRSRSSVQTWDGPRRIASSPAEWDQRAGLLRSAFSALFRARSRIACRRPDPRGRGWPRALGPATDGCGSWGRIRRRPGRSDRSLPTRPAYET